MKIQGNVVSGLGKGRMYVRQYQDYFEKFLGFRCYPGTLNLQIDKLPSFNYDKKIAIVPTKPFGIVDCYRIRINKKYEGAIIIPHKTRHGKEIIEIVAPINIREQLHVNDGDELTCELV